MSVNKPSLGQKINTLNILIGNYKTMDMSKIMSIKDIFDTNFYKHVFNESNYEYSLDEEISSIYNEILSLEEEVKNVRLFTLKKDILLKRLADSIINASLIFFYEGNSFEKKKMDIFLVISECFNKLIEMSNSEFLFSIEKDFFKKCKLFFNINAQFPSDYCIYYIIMEYIALTLIISTFPTYTTEDKLDIKLRDYYFTFNTLYNYLRDTNQFVLKCATGTETLGETELESRASIGSLVFINTFEDLTTFTQNKLMRENFLKFKRAGWEITYLDKLPEESELHESEIIFKLNSFKDILTFPKLTDNLLYLFSSNLSFVPGDFQKVLKTILNTPFNNTIALDTSEKLGKNVNFLTIISSFSYQLHNSITNINQFKNIITEVENLVYNVNKKDLGLLFVLALFRHFTANLLIQEELNSFLSSEDEELNSVYRSEGCLSLIKYLHSFCNAAIITLYTFWFRYTKEIRIKEEYFVNNIIADKILLESALSSMYTYKRLNIENMDLFNDIITRLNEKDIRGRLFDMKECDENFPFLSTLLYLVDQKNMFFQTQKISYEEIDGEENIKFDKLIDLFSLENEDFINLDTKRFFVGIKEFLNYKNFSVLFLISFIILKMKKENIGLYDKHSSYIQDNSTIEAIWQMFPTMLQNIKPNIEIKNKDLTITDLF